MSSKIDLSKIKKTKKTLYYGIDVSHYQPKIKYSKLDTFDFVIIKKSEGVTLSDSKFKQHFDSIKNLKTAYHFFRPECDGVKQANFFLNGLDLKKVDIKPIVDVEICSTWKKISNEKAVKNLKLFINQIEKEVGSSPIIYTSPIFWDKYVGDIENCNYILWVADYRDRESPQIPIGFNEWIIWQKTPKFVTDAIEGYVDLNVCVNLDTILLRD